MVTSSNVETLSKFQNHDFADYSLHGSNYYITTIYNTGSIIATHPSGLIVSPSSTLVDYRSKTIITAVVIAYRKTNLIEGGL